MKKLNEIIQHVTNELKGLFGTMLISERMNTQRCIAKDRDTTKTIIDYTEKEDEFNQEDLNKIGAELCNMIEDLKDLGLEFLISERINTQRCIAKDIDTTKTIIDYTEKEDIKEFNSQEIKDLSKEIKGILDMILVSERINTQRCIAKDIDTTKTIIDYKKDFESTDDMKNMIEELKGLLGIMLVSERMNTQRCIAKDKDTTKTIIDKK